MPQHKPRYFRVYYLDRDAQTFSISDVISDDTDITNQTVHLQESGRNVNICTTEPKLYVDDVPSVEELVGDAPDGYTLDPQLKW